MQMRQPLSVIVLALARVPALLCLPSVGAVGAQQAKVPAADVIFARLRERAQRLRGLRCRLSARQANVPLGGREVGEKASGLGSGVWRDGKGMSYLHGIARNVGQRLALRADIEIFETSIPPEHMWAPQGGDYRMLWKGSIEGTLPAPDKEGKP